MAFVVSFLWGTTTLLLEEVSIQTLLEIGFGSVDSRTTILSSSSNESVVLWSVATLANLAQPLLSALYFLYNGVLTIITLGMEWDSYGRVRKGLRVSGIPQGAQCGTHVLQLPSRLAIPFIAMSGLLHWLASQSFFAVSLDLGQAEPFLRCGYSPLGIICLLITLLIHLSYFFGLAASRFNNGLPIAGSCSAAIAAECHPTASHSEMSKFPLQWGCLEGGVDDPEVHCAFWHIPVNFPKHSMSFEHWVQVTRKDLMEKGMFD